MVVKRVLISAYACEPDKGSEPLAGWQWVNAIARVVDEVHVVTRANNQPLIQKALDQHPLPNVIFHYFDLPKWARFWKKGQRGVHLYYYLWQYGLRSVVTQLHERYQFDVAHHVTMAGMQYPPGLAVLADRLPFIWGPVGASRVPPSLKPHLHFRARLSEMMHELQFRFAIWSPLTKCAFHSARLLLAFPNALLPLQPRAEVLRVGNIHFDFDQLPDRNQECKISGHNPLHIVSAFRAIFWKGGDLAIEALARLKARGKSVRWSLLGDGPELRRWRALAQRLGVIDLVRFVGHLPREKALEVMRGADVLLHPAYREGWGAALIEGMALGLPVVCLDWGAPAHIVDEESGFKVPVDRPKEAIVEGLAEALEALMDPSLRQRMGEAAQERVWEHFSLNALNQKVEMIYGRIK